MNKYFKAYYVWPHFPSISMSGTACALHCKHCNHTYLNDMRTLPSPEDFYNTALKLSQRDAVGFLLSGGCTKRGEMLNLKTFLPKIKQIKQETDLVVKLHTGIVDRTLAEEIVAAGVDIASVEVVGSNDTIKAIFDSDASIDSYTSTLINLEQAGMPHIVPHICIGLHYGQQQGESKALELIKEHCDPSLLVFIVFRPTKGTEMHTCMTPSPDLISTIITKAKEIFPNKDLSLGCIRPRAQLRQDIESAALKAGVTRMEIPSKTTLTLATQMGYTIKKVHACCALPEALEKKALVC